MRRSGFIGLGSNLGNREQQLRAGLDGLAQRGAKIAAVSSMYESAPVGVYAGEQGNFLNAAALIETELEPEALLEACKEVEAGRGRDFDAPRHGPRPLDLDILLLGDLELRSERLTIPHPALAERRFVLIPLLELDPDLTLPDGRQLDRLAAAVAEQELERIGPLPG